MSLESFLDSLADTSNDVPASDFIELCDLLPEELGMFARTWVGIDVERQRRLISTMVELAEGNPELDFGAIFKMCLKHEDEVVLETAMQGLWEKEDRSIIPSLLQTLRSDKSPRVRSAAAAALGKFSLLVQEGKLLPKDRESIHNSLMTQISPSMSDAEVWRR